MSLSKLRILASMSAAITVLLVFAHCGSAAETIDFNHDIRPILSEKCFHCHGPDAKAREADLRLDTFEGATADRGGYQSIVPGDAESSEVYRRIVSDEEFEQMPPPESKRTLTDQQKELIREWIAGGAAYARHWAFVKPTRPDVPAVKRQQAVRNAIDAFVLRRLERDGLTLSPPADAHALIRRVSLDLVGLPPAPEEVADFVAQFQRDPEAAYESLVDRLLESERFGECWARQWLDLARYADSNGFQADQLRDSWAYRDWVIDALNANMPFDRFTIEQLAGDLLPEATAQQQIATGFHRTVTCNVEAGVHAEENRTNQVIDRVNTTGTVWLGVTMECVQCHNHKYDPFDMEDYYSLFAYFNNTPLEVSLPSGTNDVSHDFVGPFLDLPLSTEQQTRAGARQAELDSLARDRGQLMRAAEKELNARIARTTPEVPQEIAKILRKAEAKRSSRDRQKLLDFCSQSQPELKRIAERESQARKELDRLKPAKTLVMLELEQPRVTHVLNRGNYLDRGERVAPRTPGTLHPLDPELPPNRLGLARWLVSEDNPLTPRVTVNRWWAELFGHGIVATLEDFGTQAAPPTHPDLLDWLAVEFRESGWDRKHVLKCIVMSATYRQGSRTTSELLEKDPANRLYARGPRVRLDAERIRDNALTVSGLLSTKMHGPPVMPYQPPGIWRQVGRNEPKWVEAKDEDRWRRGIYIVYRRAAPYPSMVNFDASDRGACIVKRPRTNTPLQALTLLNDPAYVEMAVALADRILTESPQADVPSRLDRAYRTVLARSPTPAERDYLAALVNKRCDQFAADPAAAEALLRAAAAAYEPKYANRAELAAWFFVANVLLNLDETITKG